MNFQESFNAAYDAEKERSQKEGKDFAVNSSTLRILAFMWNMIVIAENKLDNLVSIGSNNEIKIIEVKGKTSKPSTGKKTADKPVEGQNGAETEKQGSED